MLFSDYVRILRKNSQKRIGNKKMCDLLFDPVIRFAEVEREEDRPIEIDKSKISTMMNGTTPVHEFIRNHINDDSVNDKLVQSFQDNVVPVLLEDSDDLIYQLLQKVELDNISPTHKAMLRRMAKQDTLAHFLVGVFVYAVITNSEDVMESSNIKEEKCKALPSLIIRGIDNGHVLESVSIKPISELLGDTEEAIHDIRIMIEEVKSKKTVDIDEKNSYYSFLYEKSPYKYDKNDICLVVEFCKSIGCDLPEDFFELGDLTKRSVQRIGMDGVFRTLIEGSQESKDKLKALDSLTESIKTLLDKMPFHETFSNYYYISLALENNGTDYDEDVMVNLKFPLDTVVVVDDFKRMDKKAVRYCVKEAGDLFSIQRGSDYLGYKETQKWQNRMDFSGTILGEHRISEEDVRDLLQYYFSTNDDYEKAEVTFDSINQHTVVAFPKIILLKTDSIDSIEYSIRSKRLPNVIEGRIDCK